MTKGFRRHFLLLVCAGNMALGAAGRVPEAPSARAPLSPAPDSIPRLLAPGIISTGDDESHAVFSPDGKSLYFLKNSPTFDFWTIVTSEWTKSGWKTPAVVPFSGRWSDADPFFTEDGSRLYFISTRPVGGSPKEDTDLWMVERTTRGDWGVPAHLGAAVNSPASEWFPTVTRSGTLYFGSEREGGQGGADIWRSKLVNGKYQTPENLGEPINTPAGEFEPMVSADERLMVFAAIGRAGGLGAFDLWISYNREGHWSKPEHMGAPINSPGWDFGPRLSPDGRTLVFTSSRGSVRKGLNRALEYPGLLARLHAPGNGLRDIYYVNMSALPVASQAAADTTGVAHE